MSEPQQKKRINLPTDFDETDRSKVAQLAIEKIVERTNNSIDANGKRFPNYSDAYANSLEFKIAGKNKNEPNLQLSGDMLNSIQVLEDGPGFVTIGFNEGTTENDKAAWAAASDNGPSRKFLGLTDSELELIISEVRIDRPTTLSGLALDEQQQQATRSATDSFIKNLLKGFSVDTSEE